MRRRRQVHEEVATLLGVALVVAAGCARPKEAPARTSGDQPAQVCAALAGPGGLAARLANALPLQLGGALYVFEGTGPGSISPALEDLGLRETHVVGCGANDVVVFVPGVEAGDVDRLEASIAAGTKARAKEKVAVPPTR